VPEVLAFARKGQQKLVPTPSTYATLMYFTSKDPFTNEKIFVEKTEKGKERQKAEATR
jgi:hypothetical protein